MVRELDRHVVATQIGPHTGTRSGRSFAKKGDLSGELIHAIQSDRRGIVLTALTPAGEVGRELRHKNPSGVGMTHLETAGHLLATDMGSR